MQAVLRITNISPTWQILILNTMLQYFNYMYCKMNEEKLILDDVYN